MEEASEQHAEDRITRHYVQKRKISLIQEGESINSAIKDAEIDSIIKPGGQEMMVSMFSFLQNLDIQVEDVRIRAILSALRKRVPVTEGYVEVKDGGKWKQICDSEWNELNSRVICGMFGFPGEKNYNARVYK